MIKRIKNFWNDYFSITRFQKGYRAGMDAGLENGSVLVQRSITIN